DHSRRGEWDRFSVRNLALAVQRLMSGDFDGDSHRMREALTRRLADSLGVDARELSMFERQAFENIGLVLSLISGLDDWNEEDKRLTVEMIQAKMSPDESDYVRLQERHSRLRGALLKLGERE